MRTIYRNFEEMVGSGLLLAICAIAIIKVTSRYVLKSPTSWAEEVITYLFVWLTFIGASLALKKHQHFAIDIVVEKLPDKISNLLRLISTILVIIFSIVVLWYGAFLTIAGWHIVTPATEIPRSIPYAAVPFGGLLMLIRSIEDLIRQIKGLTNKTVAIDKGGE